MPETCPYCSTPIEPQPKRGRPCPHCGEKFYVREGELYTWAGAREFDKIKRRKYKLEARICPNCGDIFEAVSLYFKTIRPCIQCSHYIDWHHNEVVKWSKVTPDKSWYNPYYPVPGRGSDMEPVNGVMPFVELKLREDA